MRNFTIFALIFTALVAFMALGAFADEAKHEFVGPQKCKGCHKDQHASWMETKHANAFTVLTAEEQKDEACIPCHTSGVDKTGAVIEGVTCEACHGAGGDYKSAKIMSKKSWSADPDGQKKLAIEAGLVYPTEETCKTCHKKEGNANFKEFDFAKTKGTVHPTE